MRLTLDACDVLIASWQVEPGRVQRALPASVVPSLTSGGKALVSLVGVRNAGLRANGKPAPGFRQLTLRTYVEVGGEQALFLIAMRVTPSGLLGVAYGMPVRPAAIRVSDGLVASRTVGVRVLYGRGEPARAVPEVGGRPLGSHDVAYLVSAGLRRLPGLHDQMVFEQAELLEPPRLDFVLSHGFDVGAPDSLLYAARTSFELELPPGKVVAGDGRPAGPAQS
jgi:hypothetical protein